jgi:hypothetical protein
MTIELKFSTQHEVIVTMCARVEIIFVESGLRQKLTLCYPSNAESALEWVSAFRRLARRSWDRSAMVVTVLSILFQPEASVDDATLPVECLQPMPFRPLKKFGSFHAIERGDRLDRSDE